MELSKPRRRDHHRVRPRLAFVHIYAMSSEDQDSHKLVFSPALLAVSLFVLTLAGRAVLAIYSTGEPIKDFFILLACYVAVLLGYLVYDELRD